MKLAVTACPRCKQEYKIPPTAEGLRISCLCGQKGLLKNGCFIETRRGKLVVAKGKRRSGG